MQTARSVWQHKPATQKALALLVATAVAARLGHEGWAFVQGLMAGSEQFFPALDAAVGSAGADAAPLAMGAAAGASVFVVANEMLRESVRYEPMRRVAPLFAGGFATMTVASSLFS